MVSPAADATSTTTTSEFNSFSLTRGHFGPANAPIGLPVPSSLRGGLVPAMRENNTHTHITRRTQTDATCRFGQGAMRDRGACPAVTCYARLKVEAVSEGRCSLIQSLECDTRHLVQGPLVGWLLWLVFQNLFNLLDNLGREPWQNV